MDGFIIYLLFTAFIILITIGWYCYLLGMIKIFIIALIIAIMVIAWGYLGGRLYMSNLKIGKKKY